METRESIRRSFGIVQLEHPDVANKPLSESEAESYREFMEGLIEDFKSWADEKESEQWSMIVQLEGSYLNLKEVGEQLKTICAKNNVKYRVDRKHLRKL